MSSELFADADGANVMRVVFPVHPLCSSMNSSGYRPMTVEIAHWKRL